MKTLSWLLPAIAIVGMFIVFLTLQGLIADQHQANIDSCNRGNESRLATVENLRGDRMNLEADRNFLHAAIAPSEGREALVAQKNAAIRRKVDAVKRLISSQRTVAAEPGSPVVDCTKAFP